HGIYDAGGHTTTVAGATDLILGTYLASTSPQDFLGGLSLSDAATLTGYAGAVNTTGVNLSGGRLLAPAVLHVTGTSTQTARTFDGQGGTMNISGDFVRTGGTFSADGNTVVLSGGKQAIKGTTTFANLTKVAAAPATLTFQAGTTQTVSGTLTLHGAAA